MQKDKLVFYEKQDDAFYYIADYTFGATIYGVTWEEIGLKLGMKQFAGE